ncbi:MAG: YggS family pyridoxal phosphate-dependent enzyme [Serratia liquefaciens]|nr:YggS family pyridoxal phosphate-dependent enzyme [Serratia liquefaciens]
MSTIQQNLQDVRNRIAAAAQGCARAPEEVTLLAVSKTKPVAAIAEAIAAGQRTFGENYVQEGVDKVQHFAALPEGATLEWHFIGPLQSNKSRLVAEHFAWCHTVDRLRIAQRLSDQRPADMPPINVLIQINISDEQSKSGIVLAELPALAEAVVALPNVRLRGLMAIPAPQEDYQSQLAVFRQMHDAFLALQQHYPQVDTLSMGMTDDMTAAVTAGSTLVRIGTAIFGARDYSQS